ncbi:MAG: hypothetical protein ACTILN_10550 [Marinobacter sp.]
MSRFEALASVIQSDRESGRFLVLVTEDGQVAYSHWRPFQLAGYPVVQVGESYKLRLGYDRRDGETLVVREVLGTCQVPDVALKRFGPAVPSGEPQHCSQAELIDVVQSSEKVTVVSNVTLLDGCEQEGLDIDGSVILVNCHISGDFRWLKARVRGSLWFLNCRFSHHFSLKSSVLDGSCVFFGCDFSGAGGVSLRGVQACSVLLEFGTRGSDDMLWLNEMTLRGCLALNGTFEAPVQLLAKQDETPVNDAPSLGQVFIGRQSYRAEKLSRNYFEGGIVIDGYQMTGDLEIRRSRISALTFVGVTCAHLLVDCCEIDQDVVLEGHTVSDEDKGIIISDTVIGRHLTVSGRYLRGFCSLAGTSVGHAWMLELENPEEGTPRMDITRFHAQHAWFEPIRLLYGDCPVNRFAKPPAFGLLAREHLTEFRKEDRRHLAEAYTRFKNWMADTGHLREEDHAFFHMRHYKESHGLQRWLLGGIFGWGIRFRNILMSALLVTLAFAVVYFFIGFRPNEAAMLSLQSFISSFFGSWPEATATGLLSVIVTLESMTGVLFVTVLVGAYIRKLLR